MLDKIDTAIDITPTRPRFFDTVQSESAFTAHLNQPDSTEQKKNVNDLAQIDDIFKWTEYKHQDKMLSDSLIVEISSFDLNNIDSKSTESSVEIVKSDDCSSNDEVSKTCKIVACLKKDEEPGTKEKITLNQITVTTSTPKKKGLNANFNKLPRTPLMSISNSPNVMINNKTQNSPGLKKANVNKIRSFPKAPSTPMNPLFKTTNSQYTCQVDKENY